MRSKSEDGDLINIVRKELIQKSNLMEKMAKNVKIIQFSSSDNSIVIGAPHEAHPDSPLAGGHDVDTGPVALKLAEILGAKCVIFSEFRAFVDVNKNPYMNQSELNQTGQLVAKRMKLFYQSQLFSGFPLVIIEIHGHVTGNYDVEISSGSELDKQFPLDIVQLKALEKLKNSLARHLNDLDISHGIYPLDSDIHFKASKTYTFQRIDWLRQLGIPIFGLHIELHKKLRRRIEGILETKEHRRFIDVLLGALRLYINDIKKHSKRAYEPQKTLVHVFDDSLVKIDFQVALPHTVQMAPRELIGRDVALLNVKDMQELGIKQGDVIFISKFRDGSQAIKVECTPGDRHHGTISIPKQLREQLQIEKGEKMYLGIPSQCNNCNSTLDNAFYLYDPIENIFNSSEMRAIWVPSSFYDGICDTPDSDLNCDILLPGRSPIRNVLLKKEDNNHPASKISNKSILCEKEFALQNDLIAGDIMLLKIINGSKFK